MKLIASMIVRDERGRYLEACVGHLLEFVDEVRILDDGSSDGGPESVEGDRVLVFRPDLPERQGEPAFYRHAALRNLLLHFTLEGAPSHILAIDADEFVADGASARAACENEHVDAWSLCLQEIWDATPHALAVRQDGGWQEHDVPLLWRPDRIRGALTIADRGHATGRVPDVVYRIPTGHACTELLHFGWTNEAERLERYERYSVGDGGRFHAKVHLESIMWLEGRVRLTGRPWPAALSSWKPVILEHAAQMVAT